MSRRAGREGRRLVLVDMENIAGGSLKTPGAAAWSRRVVEEALAVSPEEHVIVGVSSISGLFHAKSSWPQARVVLRMGTDGADLALLGVLSDERIEERFGRVSIVSGDGIFAEMAARLGQNGVAVTAASWRRCMSLRLRLAVTETVLLDEPHSSEFGVTA